MNIATNPQTRPILVRRLRKLYQVTEDQVSDVQLLNDSLHSLNRAMIEADIALQQFGEAVHEFGEEAKRSIIKRLMSSLGLSQWIRHVVWRLCLFGWIVDYQLTKTWKAAWRWSQDPAWDEYFVQGMDPHQALKEELHETGEDN